MRLLKKNFLILTLCLSFESLFAIGVTPDERLIYAVKGVKSGLALLSCVFLNPLAGLFVSYYQPDENRSDLVRIDAALEDGANIDFQELYSGYTALIYAAYKGYPKIAAHLLAKGANIEVKEYEGYDALSMANYYVKEYTLDYERNESRELSAWFTAEMKQSHREYYQRFIDRYQEIVDLIEASTHSIQSSWLW